MTNFIFEEFILEDLFKILEKFPRALFSGEPKMLKIWPDNMNLKIISLLNAFKFSNDSL